MRHWMSLWKRLSKGGQPDNSYSEKRSTIRLSSLVKPGIETDDHRLLFREHQVILMRLCVCRNRPNSHIIIIIIAFKGAVWDFLQSPHSAANCLQHVCSSGPGAVVCKTRATHRALIMCKCHVTCHLVQRDSSTIKFDSWSHIYLSFILLALPHMNYKL